MMKYLKKLYKIFVLTIILCSMYCGIAFATEESLETENSDVENSFLVGSISQPINHSLNNSPNYFCGEKGVRYGTVVKVGDNDTSKFGYHATFSTSSNIKIIGEDNFKPSDLSTTLYKYWDYMDESDPVPSATTYSNYMYFAKTWTPRFPGTAFILACYSGKYTRGSYEADPVQDIVTQDLENKRREKRIGDLTDARDKFNEYNTASQNPNVNVYCASNVGTIIAGSNYRVGPFTMSNYVRAVDYVFSDSTWLKSEWGNLQDAFGTAENRQGTIISAVAVLNNGQEISFPVPSPGETFYVDVPISSASGADELVSLKFTYQRITASASGTLWKGQQLVTTWGVDDRENSVKNGCSTYDCTECAHTGISRANRSDAGKKHTYWCGGDGYCEYGYDSSDYGSKCDWDWDCGKSEHSHSASCKDAAGNIICGEDEHDHDKDGCGKEHACDLDYCEHDYKDGHHTGTECSGTTECKHGHTTCMKFRWKSTSINEACQDGLEATGSLDFTRKEYTIEVKVPLTTNVSIYKYITKVVHADGTVLHDLGDTRKTNKPDTVKVERGDTVTYKIVIENNSRFDIRLKTQDILPSPISGSNVPEKIATSAWIQVDANKSYEATITLRPEAVTGKGTNTVKITTKNDTNPHMEYVSYGGHGPGPIVNLSSRLQDSDTYEIKEYNVSIDKSIVKVEHLGNGQVIYSGNDRKNIAETSKSASPVYVEYGDRVTYEIDIYNTTTPYVTDRNASPYWNPDKVYVIIEDTLPKKYSELKAVYNRPGIGPVDINPIVSSGKFRISSLEVPAGGKITITVSLIVEEHNKSTIETNNVKFVGSILNINKVAIKNNSSKTSTSDYYHLNDYNLDIHKYIYSYNHQMTDSNNRDGFTNEAINFTDRYGMSETDKSNKPLAVEKTETVGYALRLNNNSVSQEKGLASGIKRATSVRPTDVTDVLDIGLEYKSVSARIYKADGSDKYGALSVTVTNLGNNTYKFTVPNKASNGSLLMIDSGEYMIYYVNVQVTKTNMYLYKLSNMGIITTLTNINNVDRTSRIVKTAEYDENIATQQTSSDYVKLKDLVISGRVWLDSDKDGYMGKNGSGVLKSYIDHESNPSTNLTASTDNSEYAMKGIVVKLYSVSEGNEEVSTLVRTTKTDENGLFTFGKREDGTTWYNGNYSYADKAVDSEQRIPKATNKDSNLNYNSSSKYIKYYVEYEYDGVAYKSTEVYSGTDNLKNDGTLNSNKYKIDSNADEFKKTRDEFDKNYEIMGYNKAYNGALSSQSEISYEKVDHNSYLIANKDRVMTARSFIIETDAATLANNCRIAMNSCGAYRWKECSNHWKNWKGLIESGYFDETQFANTTQGRIQAQAYLRNLYNEVIKNLANDGNTQITKYLWLYKPAVESDKPETEYLKYINLGLEEREDIDISVVQDVYEVHNTVNGEEMTYWYNQNRYALDGSNVDHSNNGTSEDYEAQFYMTRKKANSNNDNVAINPYEFKYYVADYKYKVENYNVASVRDYKTKDSELNSEITFRIKVTNNAITNDEPYAKVKDIKVYAGINEVIEYFDNKFMNIEYNDDGTVKTINVKTKDEDGYLVDTPVKIADCWFVLPNGSKIPATMSGKNTANDVLTLANSSIYNENRSVEGYNTVYIRPNTNGINKVILAEGEDVDILIKFTVGKDDARNLKTGLTTAIAEVGAYSTYYKNTDGTYYPAGLVDKDSNPGNFGETYKGISYDVNKNNKAGDSYLKLYEDDTYKTGIDLKVNPPDTSKRYLEGQVWDDARSEEATKADGSATTDGIQYVGDGKNGTVEGVENKTANENAKLNKILKNSDGTYKEKNDFAVKDVGVSLVEVIRVPVDASGNIITNGAGTIAEERVYEDTIIPDPENSVVDTRTDENGKYEMTGYIPGEYVVRFSYGDDASIDQMNIFNGQDYKSTTYQAGSEYADTAYLRTGEDGTIVRDSLNNPKKDTDKVLRILEAKGISDAKDDEMRRLETISYSETLNNNKTLILRGINSTNKKLQSAMTSMYSETADFLVRAEKENRSVNILTYQETIAKLISEKRHEIQNIDLGLQYRPEQQVALNKYVKSLTVTTSNTTGGTTEPLVDAKFNEYYGLVINTDSETGVTNYLGYRASGSSEYETIRIPEDYLTGDVNSIKNYVNDFLNSNGLTASSLNNNIDECKKNQDGTYQVIIAGTELDTENSVGLSNLQYVPNDKDSHAIDSNQGFVYLNIDDEIMQGAEIKIEYLFTGHNLSEIDRVSKNLSKLRFKDNMTDAEKNYYGVDETGYNAIAIDAMRAGGTLGSVSLITKSNSDGEAVTYSGALTARNDLFNEYYRYEIESVDPAKATTDNLGRDVIYRIKQRTIGDGNSDYYGRYLGLAYYTGKVGTNDVVADLKLDKILDYVDNNLVFKEEDNPANSIDKFWRRTTASELVLGGYIDPKILEFSDSDTSAIASISDATVEEAIKAIQKYSDKTKLNSYLELALSSGLELSAIKDYTDLLDRGTLLDSEGVAYNTSERSNLALLQDVRTSDGQTEGDIANADITKFLSPRDSKDENSFGKAKIMTSKIISAEDETANMSYENVGEIVEYSSVTGRVTNLSTTLGNVKLGDPSTSRNNSPEYEDAKRESDTAAVEKITLTPPTGLSRTSAIIHTAVKGASYVGIVGIVIAIVVFGTLGGITLYRKRRIK